MKPVIRMTSEAEAAAQRYGTLVESWRSLYQRALDAHDFGMPRVIARVEREAYELAHRFLADETAHIERATGQIALDAQGATFAELSVTDADEFTEAVSDHLSEAESYLNRELAIQIERDIAFLKLSLRRAMLQVSIAARAQRIATRTALIQYRIGNAQELHFFFHDRGNQKWPSRKFVRAVWRHHLLAVYNEVVLLTLSDHGLEEAEVRHLNPKSDVHLMRIAMGAGTSLPTYAEIRNEVFHPNADAILGRVSDVPA